MSVSSAASIRLSHLLDLADQGPALRTALAEEVADLLTHWPGTYPPSMRGAFEALLARCARDVEPAARARLRVQLYADPDLSARVFPRKPARALVETARAGGDVAAALAGALDLEIGAARAIVADGEQLVLACKAVGLDRAACSALILTAGPRGAEDATLALLDSFDAVTLSQARGALRAWRGEPLPA